MLDVVGSLPRMLADEKITAKKRPLTKCHVRSRSLSPSRENRVIPHRSRKIYDLILDWGERERKAIEVEAEDILYNTMQKGLSSILSPRETKKPVLDSSPPTNGMSSLERQASNSDGSKTEQHRARHHYHYGQELAYNDNTRPKRSHSASRYSDHSEYRRDDYVRSDDYRHDAESRSYQHYRYESRTQREVQSREKERVYTSQHAVRSQQYAPPYRHKEQPRDVRSPSQNGEDYWSQSSNKHVTSPTTHNGQYLPGPPKPPRRQQSLNRIHIPSGPNYDEDPKSPSDMEYYTSPESGSPNHWQTHSSHFIEPQRGFAIVASPTSKTAPQDHGYTVQKVERKQKPAEDGMYNRPVGKPPTNKYPQQSYDQKSSRARSSTPSKTATSPPPRQSSIPRQHTMPVSRSPPQSLPRKQNIQRSSSLTGSSDHFEPAAHSTNASQRQVANKGGHDSHSLPRHAEPSRRSVGDHQNSRSPGRPIQTGKVQARRSQEKPKQRKISSPDQGVFAASRSSDRRNSAPTINAERLVVQNNQAALHASPRYEIHPAQATSPTNADHKSGLGALLLSDRDHKLVDTEPWQPGNSDNHFKSEYISDSGISSLRDFSAKPRTKPFEMAKQTLTTSSWNKDHPNKPGTPFNEDTAHYKLYGDGPVAYSSHGNDREQKPSFERRSSGDRLSESRPSPVLYSSSSADRKRSVQPRQSSARRELLRSSSQESSDPEWNSHSSRFQFSPTSIHPSSSRGRQQGSVSDRSPQKTKSDLSAVEWQQYTAGEVSSPEYSSQISHYDFPRKQSPDLDSTSKPALNDDKSFGNGWRIRASSNRYTATMVEADRIALEPAVDGGEAYWGMESRKQTPIFAYQSESPDKIPNSYASKDSTLERQHNTFACYEKDNQLNSSSPPVTPFRENQVHKSDPSADQTSSATAERQSRFDRLKHRLEGDCNTKPRSKSLTRLDNRDRVLKSEELSQNIQSKSTDDLEELRKKGVSRGAALFIRMMRQASEESDHDTRIIEPVSIDSYVGSPQLFQPQLTKTGEPIFRHKGVLSSPDSNSESLYSDPQAKQNHPKEEPLIEAQVRSTVAASPPQAKTSEFAQIPTTHYHSKGRNKEQHEQDRLKRTPIIDKLPTSPSKFKFDSEPHGKCAAPAEWLEKHETFKHTSENHLFETKSTVARKYIGGNVRKDKALSSPSVDSNESSPTKSKIHSTRPENRSNQKESNTSLVEQEKPKSTPKAGMVPSSPTKLKSPDSEPLPTVRRGRQEVPLEWVEVLKRLRGKPKSQSSGSSGYPSPPGRQLKDNRVSADFEDALSELEHMYSVLDKEADDLFLKNYKPFEKRISELPPALQKRLRDLKEFAVSQRTKRRARRERAKSDLALKSKAVASEMPASEARKKQDVPSYHTLGSSGKLTKPTSLNLPCKINDPRHPPRDESSSDEDTASTQHLTSHLYRRPRSSDNLGYSSDSSPDLSHKITTRSDSNKSAVLRNPESRFEAITGLTQPESKQGDKGKTERAIKDSKNIKVQQSVTKNSAVDTKLTPGSRVSIESISTIDSFQLSQPFEEMSSEYHHISNDHRMDLASEEDLSPSQLSSSMESLVQSVANPGSSRLKTKPEESVVKKGKASQAVDGPRGGSVEANRNSPAPVPLASFDDEQDLDIPDPTLYAPGGQEKRPLTAQEPKTERKIKATPHQSIKTNALIKSQPSKTVRPVAKLRERYSSTSATKTETSADKFRRFVEKRDSFHSSDSDGTKRPPAKDCGMSGRSRPIRSANTHDASSQRTSEGAKRGHDSATKRGGGDSRNGRGVEGHKVDSMSSRYTKPPRHDKEKVDGIRDEYLSGKASNGEVTRVPRYSRARASGETTTDSATVQSSVTETMSRVQTSSDSSEDPEVRKARIAKYKEQRRRELAERYGLKDGSTTTASSDSDPPAARYRRERKTRNEESTSHIPRKLPDVPAETQRKLSHDSSLPSSPRSPRNIEESASTRSRRDYQSPAKDPLPDSGIASRQRSDSVSSTSSETRTRKDSVISVETQQLVDTLEASRAARRERMRRSVSDVSMDATEKIIAKHRARKSSITSEDGDVFTSSIRKTDVTIQPSHLPTLEGAPRSRISDTDSPSSSSTSGERLRSRSEPIDPSTLSVYPQQQRAVPEEHKPSPEKGVSTKQSRSRSRRQNVSITAAQIKEASAIGQKMVERKLSLTGSPQPLSSPSTSDSSDTNRNQPSSATPLVSSHDVPSQKTDLQVPLAVSKTDKHEPDSAPKKSPKPQSPPAAESAQTTQSSDSMVRVSKAEKTSLAGNGLEKRALDSTGNNQKVSPDKSPKREVLERAAMKGSPRVKSPEKLEGTKRASREATSPEKKLNRSPEKSKSRADCDMASPSKVRLKRPEIPQLLNEVRKRRNSNESNSSLSEGTLSPTRSLHKGKSSDSDSRASPASSPVHKLNRKTPEISSRLQELAKPRRVEAKKEPMQNGDAKKPERKSPTSPEKKMKARADVAIPSKSENGVIIDRNKGRDSPKLKEPKENSISAKSTQKPPTSREKLPSHSKSQVIPKQTSKTEVKQVKPSRDPPKVASKVNAKNKDISSKNRKTQDSHKQTDVKKAALATKDKDLIAMMRARALSLKDSDEDEESNLEPQTENLEQKPEDVIKVPVAQRLQVFRCAEKLDAKPPMPPISPGSPKSPKSPRLPGLSQIKPDVIEAESHGPETPKTSEAETESEPDELATLSVSEKKQMFTQISKQKDEEAAKAKPRRRFHRLRQSERSQTQPVTPEEFNSASSLAVASRDSETKEATIDEDDVSRLSLAEKMKLFHQKAKQEKPLPKVEVPKRKRRLNSRFSTQPVTIDEVKKASGINPLARSFTRPPDEVTGLPIGEQIAIVYGSHERLERKNSLSSEKSPSRRQSITSSPEKKGILKEPSLEKTDSSSDEPHKSILKSDAEIGQDLPQKGRSILKSEDANAVHSDPEVRSILKESKTSDTEETKSILRRDSKQEKDDACSDLSEKSILKKDSTGDKPLPASIITCKKTSDTVTDRDSGPERDPERPKDSPRKTALKKEDSQDADVDSGTDDPIRRKTGLATEQLRVRKGKPLMTDGCSSSDSETEVRARAKSSPIVAIRTVKKKQVPELDITNKRLKPPTTKDGKERTHSPRRLRSPEPGRFRTQPVTPQEMAQVQQLAEPVKTSGSIAERLSALQKNGQDGWQKRINKYNDSPRTKLKDYLEVPSRDYCPTNAEEDVDMATCSISKRLELIQNSQSSWKKRVEEKDVTQFTVTGKMTKAGKEVVETSPQLRRAGSGRIKRGGSFKGRVTLGDKKGGDKTDGEKKENTNTTETKDDKSQETSSSSTVTAKKETSSTTESDSDSCFRIVKKKVAVMKPDGETFTEFFTSSSSIITEAVIIPRDRKLSLDDTALADFDDLSDSHLPKLTALSRNRMSLRPKRRPHGTKNPIRALRTRSNLVTEYEETRKEMVETKAPDRDAIMKSKRVELSSKINLHQSARRGLASKEDIAKGLLKLQKVKDVREMEGKLSQLLPYKDLMLLHIKGRRFVQVRLVEPSAKMLNTGDCFVLVTPKECFLWIGEYSNVIERSKASEISQHIQTTRDLGCKAPSVVTIEETKGKPLGSTRNWKKVMELLGGTEDVKDIGRADEDELHEIYITETNMVYKVEGDSLVPYDDYWGAPPKFAMLKSNEILVFDFGSELYVWQGKQTSSKERQTAAKLAQIIWERGYDYGEFDINPIWPGQSKKPQHDVDRPDWALFGKTTEHMETVLFQNKFIDWPSESRILKNGEDEQKTEAAPDLVPYDACKMIEPSKEKVDIFLENTNIGRGRGNNASKSTSDIAHFEKIDQRGNEIVTLSVVVWHVLEYEHSILPKESFGQFHEGDTYVVRWQYRVESTGMRDLKGNLSKRGQGRGRERCVYFFWQGHCSTINEKGASALMTVELDEERGPQRQVIQGKEPPAFLQLFDGRMVIHIGKREEEKSNTPGPNRLYCVRSEHTEEGLLVETDCNTNELRSRTSFLLVQRQDNANKATICVWHGAKSSKYTRAVAKHAADMLKENKPLETGMKSDCRVAIEEMEEGHETSSFKKILSLDRSAYDSAIKDSLDYNYTPRLFHLTSKSGVFVANEILNQSRSDIITPYPFEQTELYSASQPAQFLFDNHYEVYLWQGWWPEDQDKRTGSAKMRWDVDRRCAMETVMAYCKEKRIKNPPKAYIVYAGMEPLTFTNLFPWWTVDNDVAEINKKDGKTGDRAVLVSEVLAKHSKSQYTFAELQERPLPDGVDPLKLETYLSQEEFREKLNVDKEEFYKIPAWKQLKMKKEMGLF